MAPSRASAAYKKKDGTVVIAADRASISWTPSSPRGAKAEVTIKVIDITNLQQTPEKVAKVMLKIFVKSHNTSADPVDFTFHFTSPTDARGEANAIKDLLSSLILDAKANDASLPGISGNGLSAAMAIANAVSSKPLGSEAYYDDARLKSDVDLQQSLMRKDAALRRTYEEARRTKPDTVTNGQFNTQFWSTRISILRAHAQEVGQRRGQYNVLSVVKPRTEDGELKLRITQEQVQLIFNQHPLVRRVYDKHVGEKLVDGMFWSRFFLSRLNKKLKGERIIEADPTDPIFDQYLNDADNELFDDSAFVAQVPHMIDLEGNEENQGGAKSGNRKDFTMRPTENRKAPIIRTLNRLSEKIMARVAPSDIDPSAPIGMDEVTYNELVLRDLQGESEEGRILLNITKQTRFFQEDSKTSSEAAIYAQQDPQQLLSSISQDLLPAHMNTDSAGGINLHDAIGYDEDSESEDDDEPKVPHVGSKSSLREAQIQIWAGIAAKKALEEGTSSGLSGLSQSIFDRATLTNATTIEFLHHFWAAFLSGDADRAGELAKSVESLERSYDRIKAVADDAECERQEQIKLAIQEVREIFERTGKKRAFKKESVGGGAAAVDALLEPTIDALKRATSEYRMALALEGVDIVG